MSAHSPRPPSATATTAPTRTTSIADAAAHGTAAGGKDTHGRKPGNEHYGHDHK